MKSDLIEIEMAIRHRTDRAVLASADGERAVWLPLALVEIEPKLRLVDWASTPGHRPRPPRSCAVCLAVLTASARRRSSAGRAAGSWAATA